MNAFDKLSESVKEMFESKPKSKSEKSQFVQYKHANRCHIPCLICIANFERIFERKTEPEVPVHQNCDCFYNDVEVMPAGTVSVLGEDGPDYWLKTRGRLPDYYITKKEAISSGWKAGKNTVGGKTPGKMIGGDVFYNDPISLPVKIGRVWYECDVDYFGGKRGSARLLYSNDGLMFFSPDHYSNTYYFVK